MWRQRPPELGRPGRPMANSKQASKQRASKQASRQSSHLQQRAVNFGVHRLQIAQRDRRRHHVLEQRQDERRVDDAPIEDGFAHHLAAERQQRELLTLLSGVLERRRDLQHRTRVVGWAEQPALLHAEHRLGHRLEPLAADAAGVQRGLAHEGEAEDLPPVFAVQPLELRDGILQQRVAPAANLDVALVPRHRHVAALAVEPLHLLGERARLYVGEFLPQRARGRRVDGVRRRRRVHRWSPLELHVAEHGRGVVLAALAAALGRAARLARGLVDEVAHPALLAEPLPAAARRGRDDKAAVGAARGRARTAAAAVAVELVEVGVAAQGDAFEHRAAYGVDRAMLRAAIVAAAAAPPPHILSLLVVVVRAAAAAVAAAVLALHRCAPVALPHAAVGLAAHERLVLAAQEGGAQQLVRP